MSETAPRQQNLELELPGLATDVEDTYVLGESQITGELAGASFTPVANITGAADNYREYRLINKGQDGNGTTVMATLAYSAGVNATDFNEDAFTLSAVENALDVVPGDIIAIASLAPGTGLADPGGRIKAVLQAGAV